MIMENKALEKLSQLDNHEMMRTITLEEHFTPPAFLAGPGKRINEQAKMTENFGYGKFIEELSDLGDKRITEMDAAGIDVQVLSHPIIQQLDAVEAVELAREANDYLAEAVRRYPKRFAGFVTLRPLIQTLLPRNWSAWLMNIVSKEDISPATLVDATWMTNSLADPGACRSAQGSTLHPSNNRHRNQ